MKLDYFAGLAKHLLESADHPEIAAVETFQEAGAVGPNWPRQGLRIVLRDGSALLVAFVRTSPPGGDDTNQPTEFKEADLEGFMSGVRGNH